MRLFFFLLISLILFACNKQRNVLKELTGNWTIYSYTFQSNNGLSYKYDSEGTFYFENCKNEYCSYELNMTYVKLGQQYLKNDLGDYKVEKDGEHYTLRRQNTDGTTSTFTKNRILLINKDQIKMLFQDEIGIHHFILVK